MCQKVHHRLLHLNGLDTKNATIDPKNINDRCFQYAFALTQHYGEIKSHP